ncbi:hypothetical protein DRH27_05390 [Candidatus Falkowbacteria bacterium]|nr:MAG: hypothetical protein DRH27_05390 [Candidatus Falkowbacteria bacterium]
MLYDKKNTNNIIKIIIFVFIIIIAVGLILFMDNNQKKAAIIPAEEVKNEQVNNEIEKLKQDNENAINNIQKEALLSVRPIDETDYFRGNIDAPVQVIVYNDFDCPFCADFYATVNEVIEYFKDDVVVASRYYPMRTHTNALSAALASECAAEQDKFWEMGDKLFMANKSGDLGIEQYKKDAEELSLNLVQFNECLDTEKYKGKIQEQLTEGQIFGITGTPGNFINGIRAPGAVPFADYKDSRGETQLGMKSLVERQFVKFLDSKF